MEFEWDDAKNARNIDQHGVDFARAKEIFSGTIVEAIDDRFDYGETRLLAIGITEGRELAVVYTMRRDVIRIISARRANRNERRAYYQKYPG